MTTRSWFVSSDMSATTKLKMTTIQKEIWFFTKIISVAAISLFCVGMRLTVFAVCARGAHLLPQP